MRIAPSAVCSTAVEAAGQGMDHLCGGVTGEGLRAGPPTVDPESPTVADRISPVSAWVTAETGRPSISRWYEIVGSPVRSRPTPLVRVCLRASLIVWALYREGPDTDDRSGAGRGRHTRQMVDEFEIAVLVGASVTDQSEPDTDVEGESPTIRGIDFDAQGSRTEVGESAKESLNNRPTRKPARREGLTKNITAKKSCPSGRRGDRTSWRTRGSRRSCRAAPPR